MPDQTCRQRSLRRWRRIRRPRPAIAVLSLSLICLVSTYLPLVAPREARAATLDVGATPIKFVYSSTDPQTGLANPTGKNSGDRVIYRNVTSVGGLSVDAVVTTSLSGTGTVDYDPSTGGATGSNPILGTVVADAFQVNFGTTAAYGAGTFRFDFYEAGTYTTVGSGLPVVLRNVTVASLDLDGGNGQRQFTDLTSFQTYTITSSPATNLAVSQPTPGLVRFISSGGGDRSNVPEDRAAVTYDSFS